MVRLPTHRPPTHPGEALREDFLPDAGLSQSEAARRLRMSFRRLNEITNERRAVTPDTALRLAKLFGQTPDFLDEPPDALGPVPRAPLQVCARSRPDQADRGGVA
jgi:addiction module HigA family antidote